MKTSRVLVSLLALAGGAMIAIAQPAGDRPPRRAAAPAFTANPMPKDEAEKRILDALEAVVQEQGRGIGVPQEDGRLLRILAEGMGAKHVVELGTFHGYSGIWFCLALRTTGGRLTTYEIDAQNAALARRNFERAGVSTLVTVIEGDAHEEVTKLKDPIDLIFLDADKEGYADYLKKLLPLLRPGGLVVAHNIDPGRADPRFIEAITTNPVLESVFPSLGRSGLSLTIKKR
ncbi:MAG TPA: class I SAM-dependent methyltransferase [Verrucomicrobiota bacterium]|nr:class I SAM-dependent methyltransferase [Verrucomicrobiota bacterium]HNU50850.1 class I SAM-dependent methyltransferase [Verrucomicrobiota bacterium]